MEKTVGKSKARPGRNPASITPRAKTGYSDSNLTEAIEEERTRLMQVESLLHCIRIAMEDNDRGTRSPYYPSMLELIRGLVSQSIGALDSVRLRPMIEQMKADKPYPMPEERLGLGLRDDSVKDSGNVLYLS